MKKLSIILILFLILVSCRKIDNVTPDGSPKSTKELQVNSTFDWKTSKEITLNIIGLKKVNPQIINIFRKSNSWRAPVSGAFSISERCNRIFGRVLRSNNHGRRDVRLSSRRSLTSKPKGEVSGE